MKSFQRAAQGGFFLARADIDAGEILRALGRFQLGEVDHINRAFALARQPFQRLGQGNFRVGIFQRHGTILGRNRHRRTPVQLVNSSSKNAVSPRVADISRNRAWGSVNNGTCQATPRSRSA